MSHSKTSSSNSVQRSAAVGSHNIPPVLGARRLTLALGLTSIDDEVDNIGCIIIQLSLAQFCHARERKKAPRDRQSSAREVP